MPTRTLALLALLMPPLSTLAQKQSGAGDVAVTGWLLQDSTKLTAIPPAQASLPGFKPTGWYPATVPGTVLTTLVDNKVYPEPLYGENMRLIPESLNKTNWWYRTTLTVPASHRGRLTALHFGGINYAAEIWVNGRKAGTLRGAFLRGDFDITPFVKPGRQATLLVIVSPQPHPGIPHEHTQANGVGQNGGETALDGPTFLSTIGWDWLPAVRDRDTGIYQPVTLTSTGPVIVRDPVVTSTVDLGSHTADLHLGTTLRNASARPVTGTLIATVSGHGAPIILRKELTLPAGSSDSVALDTAAYPALHLTEPQLWWPNGYGPQNLYTLELRFETGKEISSAESTHFGIRKIDYQVPDSENLTISVNGVRIMVRGGNWGLDEAMKRASRDRLDAQFHMHALANLNLIRNWVGQSTNPDFYDMADKYGILLWDEFFQPNPSDGPDPADIPTYLANVTDKVVRYRNHPSIAVWCARNEGYPPKALDDTLRGLMEKLDQSRLYQSNSADGRGVSSHGPYFWRSPRFFYRINESFKTETGSVSVPTLESIQGMMPEKDWETLNDDWAQHDMARGAQRGDFYPFELAKRYGPVRNLADFVRKGQLSNYEAFRAMYEGRNAEMFKSTTGVITWMSHPAQPSFVWQLYHYDLEPNSSLYAAKKAAETIHVQLNEANAGLEVVNNTPAPLSGLTLKSTIYSLDGKVANQQTYKVPDVPGSTTFKAAQLDLNTGRTPVYFVKLDLSGSDGKLLSTNLYWQNIAQDDFTSLAELPTATLQITADAHTEGANTLIEVTVTNPTPVVALMAHLQLRGKRSGKRILPVFYSDNYLNLAPGESRRLIVEAAGRDLGSDTPLLALDGFNIAVTPVEGSVSVQLNENAQPTHWPASQLVPSQPNVERP